MLSAKAQEALNSNMPADWVETLEGNSYVKSWVVIDEMNAIFGPGGWSYDTNASEAARYQAKTRSGSDTWRVTYVCKCTLLIPGVDGTVPTSISEQGAAQGINPDLGKAIEMAIKSSATDSLKRCIKSLGRRMGLALYDKDQEFVEDPAPPPVRTPAERKQDRKAETPEQKTERQAEHDPSWPAHQAKFMVKLCGATEEGNLGYDYDEFCSFLEWYKRRKGKAYIKPSSLTTEQRDNLLMFAGSEDGGIAYSDWLTEMDQKKGAA